MAENGICYLVGAGPGDPGLITVRGLTCLREADLVVYDYLAAPVLLDEMRPGAESMYVGKKAGAHTMKQEDICALLVENVKAGLKVVRLKGGDPFVFGRGGEEVEALARAGLAFEVIPGVTAGVAAPAYAGIPVTHRGLTCGVVFVTGHEAPGKGESEVNWKALAETGFTLCVYMGVGRVQAIASALIDGGRSPDEPAAAIRWGTQTRQQTVVATLGTLPEAIAEAGLKAPAILVIGKVLALREVGRWYETRPLFGKTILVTRPRSQAQRLTGALVALGADVETWPTISIEGNRDQLLEGVQRLQASPDWVVFTSRNGVSLFWEALQDQSLDARSFGGSKLAAIGPGTAEALHACGLRPDLIPTSFVAESLFASLQSACDTLVGKRFLLLRADKAREALRDLLTGDGAVVEDVPIYKTEIQSECPPRIREALLSGTIDLVPFTSSSTVEGFCRSLGEDGLSELLRRENRPLFISIGPVTSRTMEQAGLPVDKEAAAHSVEGVIEVLAEAAS